MIFFSITLTLALSPLCLWIARKLKLLDYPNSAPHKQHPTEKPLAGGLVIFLTLLILIILQRDLRTAGPVKIFPSVAIIFAFGLWDDKWNLPAFWKLIGQFIASVVLIISGVHVRIFEIDLINYAITILWLIGITNAFNFLDGGDGLALGISGIISAFLMVATQISQQYDLSFFCAVMIGASMGTFVYNSSPAIIFLGDSGAQMLGFFLSTIALEYNPVGYSIHSSWYIPIILFFIPIFDVSLVIISRLRRGEPLHVGSLDHTYHRLIKLSIHPSRAIAIMFISSILLSSLVLATLGLPPLIGYSAFIITLSIGIAGIIIFEKIS
jgi:UDP-GlcNAc:undecaprenyl-phosphate GlcNAc-1-phosphate transferase